MGFLGEHFVRRNDNGQLSVKTVRFLAGEKNGLE
jgi:hypothetical protein